MKNHIFRYTLLFLLLAGCTKTEKHLYDFRGDFDMKVNTYTEFGQILADKGNIEVIVQGTVPEMKLMTDTSGSCTAKELPYGTYNLIISKPGYGTHKQQLKHLGVEKDEAASFSLTQKSTTRIVNSNLLISGRTITVTGTVSHGYTTLSSYPYDWPGLIMFISDSQSVSSTNYYTYANISTKQDVNTDFQISMSLDGNKFPSGSTVYVNIYGRPRIHSSCLDVETGIYYYPALGDPSGVKSIRVP